jgi:hypothetical protein
VTQFFDIMMKFVVLILIFVTSVGFAQEDSKKRPSWSQGLPERQAAVQPGKPAINPGRPGAPEIDVAPEIEPMASGLEVELVTEPIAVPQPVLEAPTESVVTTAADRREAREQYFSGEQQAVNEQQQELIKQYQWSVLKTSPIEIPSDYSGSESLKLYIQINPKGRVVKVTRADASIPEYVVESAEKSIRRWRFEPPGDLGIEEVIGRTFTIDVVTDA